LPFSEVYRDILDRVYSLGGVHGCRLI